jgi:NAD-dependent SIR2 family protein deacetylase
VNYEKSPILTNAKEAANHLKDCKNIMILTGSGLSVASGIPTFCG